MPIELAPSALDVLSESLRRLARRGVAERYRKGRLLIEEGQIGDTIYIIVAGRLRVYAAGTRGRELTFGIYGPGEYVGEMSLDGGPRSASVMAIETSDCILITRRTLHEHIAEHPEFSFEILSKVIRRARMATLNARQLALNDAYGRLATFLNASATVEADGMRVVHDRLTHRELAHQLGCSREMVSRLIKDLETGGYIAMRGDRIALQKALPARW